MDTIAEGASTDDPVLEYCQEYIYSRRRDGGAVSVRSNEIARNLLATLKRVYDIRTCKRCDNETPYSSAAYCSACQSERPMCDCGRQRVGYDTNSREWFGECFECATRKTLAAE